MPCSKSLPLLTAAALGLSFGLPLGAAHAQNASSLQVFGRLDVGLASFKGMTDKTVTTLSSGITDSSALGVKGEEDLGGGYKAVFVLEHGLYADTGGASQGLPISGTNVPLYATSGISSVPDPTLVPTIRGALGNYLIDQLAQPFWGRQAFAGLITPFGAVLGGRTYSPVFEMFDRYDPLESGNVADPYALLAVPVGLEVRISRSLQYRIEAQGWSAAATFGSNNDSGNMAMGRFYGLNAGYETKDFSIGLGHQARRNTQGELSLVTNIAGAWWRIGDAKLMASYTTARDRHPQGRMVLQEGFEGIVGAPLPSFVQTAVDYVGDQLKVDSRVVSLGMQYQATPQLRVILNHAQLHDGKLAQGDARLWGATAEYALSKRTSIWTGVTQINNQAEQQIAPMTSGTFEGFANNPGQSTSALQLNVSHKF